MQVENELGVIVVFAQMCEQYGWKIVSIQASFPDAIIESTAGRTLRVEFEYQSSNFLAHNHDPRACDIVICWEHDCTDIILPVFELKTGKVPSTVVLPDPDKREIAYWKRRAELAEARAKKVERESRPSKDTPHDFSDDNLSQWLLDNPYSAQSEAAVYFDVSPSTVCRAIKRMRFGNNGSGWERINDAETLAE